MKGASHPNLATTRTDHDSADTQSPNASRPAWASLGFDPFEIHSDRVKLFASCLAASEQRHIYRTRATTPGVFRAPAAHCELLYSPAVHARTVEQVLRVAGGAR